jgi:hypothetical protein
MISNERPSPYGRQPYDSRQYRDFIDPKPRIIETTLDQSELIIERKTFTLVLKENPRGRFLRIVENGGSKYCSVIVPFAGMKDFQKILADMVKAAATIPARKEAAPLA